MFLGKNIPSLTVFIYSAPENYPTSAQLKYPTRGSICLSSENQPGEILISIEKSNYQQIDLRMERYSGNADSVASLYIEAITIHFIRIFLRNVKSLWIQHFFLGKEIGN